MSGVVAKKKKTSTRLKADDTRPISRSETQDMNTKTKQLDNNSKNRIANQPAMPSIEQCHTGVGVAEKAVVKEGLFMQWNAGIRYSMT